MRKRAKRSPASERAAHAFEVTWNEGDLATLADLQASEALLPVDAPRALLSIRLSVFTEETTSPVRQELDLRQMAKDKGFRVAGVASDLNVSATKVPPWKRKALGDWLVNRVPEFDVLCFWKLDRFIRNVNDLHKMMEWVMKYNKNMVTLNDADIDLTTLTGQLMLTFTGTMAAIEAANTKTRVESLWNYNKTQDEWLVGKPPYGYMTYEDEILGKTRLAIEDDEAAALREARQMIVDDGCSATAVVKHLRETGMMSQGLTTSTLLRRLRNPGLMGLRVEEDKQGGVRRSKLLYGKDGKVIRVADPIFTEDEFEMLQAALDHRRRNQPSRQSGGATQFLGVLVCADCGTNMTVQTDKRAGGYSYLRCRMCRSGGLGAPHPDAVYDALVEQVLHTIGDWQVEKREYARGAEIRREAKRLEESIAYYMAGLEPGGRFDKNRFTRDQAEVTLDKQIAELEAIDPSTKEDRWINVMGGRTFRQRWADGGRLAMAEDLLRAGVTCKVTRTKIPGVRAPQIELDLDLPRGTRKKLVVRDDEFADPF